MQQSMIALRCTVRAGRNQKEESQEPDTKSWKVEAHTRMKRSRSRSLWCVTNGRAVAPPAIMFMHGVSTCTEEHRG